MGDARRAKARDKQRRRERTKGCKVYDKGTRKRKVVGKNGSSRQGLRTHRSLVVSIIGGRVDGIFEALVIVESDNSSEM
jgi:hypothetical protein